MSDVAQACADLAAWYPHAYMYSTLPDTQPSEGRSQPQFRPPGNTAAVDAYLGIHEFARRLESAARYAVTGTLARRGGSDTNTIAALRAAGRLTEAIPENHVPEHDRTDHNGNVKPCPCGHCKAARQADGLVTAVMSLPAIDLVQPPVALPVPCPRPGCNRPMLRYYRARRPPELACLGCAVRGVVWEHVVKWADGIIT